jgi:CspA family cold shock protein
MDGEIPIVESQAQSANGEALGTVKWFSRMKGWGFIEPDGGDRDVFVHYENIVGEGFRNLEKGERARFRIEDTPRGPKAIDVVALL